MYRGMYNGIVFAASDGYQWVRLGEQNLVEGLEELLTREAVRRRKWEGETWRRAERGCQVQGGRYLVKLSPEYAYGTIGYPPLVPPNATVQFEIILKVCPVPPASDLTDLLGRTGTPCTTCLEMGAW
eukprot:757847-Hanusia_phi.AAC.2